MQCQGKQSGVTSKVVWAFIRAATLGSGWQAVSLQGFKFWLWLACYTFQVLRVPSNCRVHLHIPVSMRADDLRAAA